MPKHILNESLVPGDKRFFIGKELSLCGKGFYLSSQANAAGNTKGESLCRVTGFLSDSDCKVETETKFIEEVPWTKADSVALTVLAAKSAANLFVRLWPKNKASKQAIKAAEKWLGDPSEEKAAIAASAADSAYDFARSCAWHRRCAAECAALSARCAASSSSGKAAFHFAAYAVETAAKAAHWKGGPSARQRSVRRIEKKLKKRYFKNELFRGKPRDIKYFRAIFLSVRSSTTNILLRSFMRNKSQPGR